LFVGVGSVEESMDFFGNSAYVVFVFVNWLPKEKSRGFAVPHGKKD
jgi:hypothetical protein